MPININEYRYDLPAGRIAQYPLQKRDHSKLLVYRKGDVLHQHFYDLPTYLPENSFLFFNDTKVIPARLHFQKETGAVIEIFLLSPVEPSTVLSQTMQASHAVTWKCTIGNLKRWPPETTLQKKLGNDTLLAELMQRDDGIVRLSWTGERSFAEIIDESGETPLPPYLKRNAEVEDKKTYQTIYAAYEGAVAAPTAGLHFTGKVFEDLRTKEIHHDFLTLHVSAGTFQPVKTEDADAHIMHREQVVVSKNNVENLLHADRFVIPVGTTSMRTLESLYWYGAKLIEDREAEFKIHQNDPYGSHRSLPSSWEALNAVRDSMARNNLNELTGETSIYIKPGYQFRICKGLITNFHQPGSTLMLLVAAFVGRDWKKIYEEALNNNYRFLSYGDSSLLLP